MDLFKVSGNVVIENEGGVPKDKKVEVLMHTVNWTDSEVVATRWLQKETFGEAFGISAIAKQDGIFFDLNDNIEVSEELVEGFIEYLPKDGVSFWQSVVEFEEEGESGKPKKTKSKYIVCGYSQVDICGRIGDMLSDCVSDWKIVETKELKTSSVLVDEDDHSVLVSRNELLS